MRKVIFVFLSLLLVIGGIAITSTPATAKSTDSLQPNAYSIAITEEEKALLEDILVEIKQARELAGDTGFRLFGSSEDNESLDRLKDIENMVKELQKLIAAGEKERALKYKYVIAEKLEELINFLPLAPANLTTAALATGASNPLYDELVRIRAKIEKLIAMETTVELTPLTPPDLVIARPPQAEKMLVYSVKFLCGPSFGQQGVQRGSYSTAINVHNPHNGTVYLYKKAVIALREDDPRGKISSFRKVELKADEAIDIDCIDIWSLLYPSRSEAAIESPSSLTTESISRLSSLTPVNSMIRFITGFVVIYSTAPLDVVAVYSASNPAGFSLDVEYISPSSRSLLPGTPPPQTTCPEGCVCLTRTEATEFGLELCAGQLTQCGTDENGEPMYCWQRSQASECPDGCFCMSPEKAAELGYVLCGGEKIKCGTDANGRDLLCFQRAPPEECPDACFCLTEAEAKRLGYVLCDGQRIVCGTDANGRDLLCFQRAPPEECPDACFCLTPLRARELGYVLCGEQAIKCGTDADGQDLFCYQKPTEQQVCPDNCFCLTDAEAKRLGYVLCGGQRIECGVNAAGLKLYCFEKRRQD